MMSIASAAIQLYVHCEKLEICGWDTTENVGQELMPSNLSLPEFARTCGSRSGVRFDDTVSTRNPVS